jgi:hypothetical protein
MGRAESRKCINLPPTAAPRPRRVQQKILPFIHIFSIIKPKQNCTEEQQSKHNFILSSVIVVFMILPVNDIFHSHFIL